MRKPSYVRFRFGAGGETASLLPVGFSEVSARIDELSKVNLPAPTVFIIENEITYLAFPLPVDAIAIFGSGFGLASLEGLTWLHQKTLYYWGDLDTHGFVILDQLRQRFPHAVSLMMDAPTLLEHSDHWTVESRPATSPLAHLTGDERALYHDLIEDRYGTNLRLEQERIRFSYIEAAVESCINAS